MSFWAIIDSMLFKPLQMIFEVVYMVAYKLLDNPALSIVVLSLIMNFLVLPLYKRADAMQEEEKEMEKKLHDGVAHIKKTFRGDERMMMLQTYYRQNNYKPTYVLRGAVSLFLEIPFFIAAYRFLSELQLLHGVSFGPIADLGKADGLLTIAGVSVNILPFIMTAVNLVSCIIFTKGSPLKSKIQLYAMAVFFLVFLYASPSGLVIYWTLNNIFSLVKTIFYKLKNPAKVLSIMASVAGICIGVWGVFFYHNPTLKRRAFFIVCAVLLQIPVIVTLLKNKINANSSKLPKTGNSKIFFAGGMLLAALMGLLIPSAVINASPQEFVDINSFYNPLWFIASSLCIAVGLFVIWFGVFYRLAKPSVRALFDRAIWLLCGITIVNYMFFGRDLGILNSSLKYETGMDFTLKAQLINAAILLVVIAILWFIFVKFKKQVFDVLVIGVVAMVGMSVFNIVNINKSVNILKADAATETKEKPSFTLSKNGKNVVVIMLDRGFGAYVPYMFNEKPELAEKFSGFTNYRNVISFGAYTNFGTPALFGGYEYTPIEMNKRNTEIMVTKHNEALKVMPSIFSRNGFDVTVCDSVYANYEWYSDLSIFNDIPNVKTYHTKGTFSDPASKEQYINDNSRNFFFFGLTKSIPLCFQEILYDNGSYNTDKSVSYSTQTMTGLHTASGISQSFMSNYNVIKNLPVITNIDDGDTNTFMTMVNDVTHEPMLLQEPEYEPSMYVDNTEYDKAHEDRFTLNGLTLKMETDQQIIHYQTNMATMIQLGEWFDYLRENDVYDNTRIILVSDHGRRLFHSDELVLENGEDMLTFCPILMVKDFGTKEFKTSDEFMTISDVPTLATNGVIDNPVNPYTGKIIDQTPKYTDDQYVLMSYDWVVSENNGTVFNPGTWFTVSDDIYDINNWKMVEEWGVLPSAN